MSNQLMETDIVGTELYEEKQFTDMKAGGIKAFFPVKADGTKDESRDPIFIAVTNIDVGNGQLFPVHGRIEGATTLEGALVDFKPTLDDHLQAMMNEAERREQAEQKDEGRIITLDQVNPQG